MRKEPWNALLEAGIYRQEEAKKRPQLLSQNSGRRCTNPTSFLVRQSDWTSQNGLDMCSLGCQSSTNCILESGCLCCEVAQLLQSRDGSPRLLHTRGWLLHDQNGALHVTSSVVAHTPQQSPAPKSTAHRQLTHLRTPHSSPHMHAVTLLPALQVIPKLFQTYSCVEITF